MLDHDIHDTRSSLSIVNIHSVKFWENLMKGVIINIVIVINKIIQASFQIRSNKIACANQNQI